MTMNYSSEFLRTVNEKNLCTWYILPLIGLNKFSFQEANFVESYLTRDGEIVAVEVTDSNLCGNVMFNQFYLGKKPRGEHELLTFVLPTSWRPDLDLFRQGRYSQMSEFAKKLIRQESGLKYRVADEAGNKITDAILLALEKHTALRDRMITELIEEYSVQTPVKGYELKPADFADMDELLSPPSERCYIEI